MEVLDFAAFISTQSELVGIYFKMVKIVYTALQDPRNIEPLPSSAQAPAGWLSLIFS
jgi:hypothetical protein